MRVNPPGKKPDPNSLIRRVVTALRARGSLTRDEFNRVLQAHCETKQQMKNLSADLVREGFIEKRIMLTQKAMQ